VQVRDTGGLTDSKTFAVTVTSGNRAPVLGALADDRTAPGANYVKLLTATDPDGDPLTFELLNGPSGLALTGTQLRWQPTTISIGSKVVQVAVRDPAGARAVGGFRIEVESNTPPLARDDQYSVKVGETLTVAAPGVLTNDADAEGSPLNARKLTDPALGTLNSFNTDGSFSYTAPTTAPMAPFAVVGRRLTDDLSVGQDLFRWPVLGDLNRDGKPDLITSRFNGFRIIATGGSAGLGPRLWGVNPPCAQQPHNSPADLLADIDDDGRLEFVHATVCPGENSNFSTGWKRLQALADDGQVKWTSPFVTQPIFDVRCSNSVTCETTPTRVTWTEATRDIILSIARLAANEAPTLMYRQYVVASAAFVYARLDDGSVDYKYYGCRIMTGQVADMGQECLVTVLVSPVDGSVQQVLRAPIRPYQKRGLPYVRNSVVAVDLDGDGVVELVSGADVWKRVTGQWMLAWQGIVEPAQVAVADLDGDGKPEIIYHVDHTAGGIPNDPLPSFSGFIIYDRNGVELRRISFPMGNPGPLTVVDVDGDNRPELLIAHDGFAQVINSDGSLKWSYTAPDSNVVSWAPAVRTCWPMISMATAIGKSSLARWAGCISSMVAPASRKRASTPAPAPRAPPWGTASSPTGTAMVMPMWFRPRSTPIIRATISPRSSCPRLTTTGCRPANSSASTISAPAVLTSPAACCSIPLRRANSAIRSKWAPCAIRARYRALRSSMSPTIAWWTPTPPRCLSISRQLTARRCSPRARRALCSAMDLTNFLHSTRQRSSIPMPATQ
jgi:hypothetical protein